MKLRDLARAADQWVPFAARTVAWGTWSLLFGPLTRDHRASLYAMQRWCRSSLAGLRIDVAARGLERVPAAPPFVYCANHQSIVDIIVLGAVLPHDYKWAAKRSMMNVPFLGWHLRLAGHVPVDRGGGPQAAKRVIERLRRVLADGKPLLVFPEGTRTPDGALQAFKLGSFYAAVQGGAPVVPVAVEGTYRMMKKGAFDTGVTHRRVVQVAVGAPIYPRATGSVTDRARDLRDRTHAAVADLLRSLGGASAPPRADAVRPPPERAEPYADAAE